MKSESLTWIVLLCLAAALFGLNAGGYDLWPPDEPRYAEVAREMVVSGDYLVPHVNGETYTEKPPLLFWAMALFSLILGESNAWSVRLPSILSGIYVVGMVYVLGRRMFNARVAFWAALVLITCFRFWYQARRGQIDVLLTATMITALYGFWRWDLERRNQWLVLAYAAMGAGMLAKGPPALVFPLLFLFAFYWKNPAGRKKTHWVLGSLAAIGAVLLWYVPARLAGADTAVESVGSDIGGNLFRNTIGRFVLGVSKAQPPWYYLKTLPVDLLPWTFIAPPILYWAWKNRKTSQAMWALYAWLVPALIFFSISIGKRELYLLPLLPVFALVFGAAIVHLQDAGNLRWMKRGGVVWSALLTLLAFSPLAQSLSPYPLQEPIRLYLMAGTAGLCGVGGLIVIFRQGGGRVPAVLVAQVVMVYSVAVFTVYPEIDGFKSARPICEPVRNLVEKEVPFALYSVGFSREEYIYYSRRFHQPVFTGLIGTIPEGELLEQAELQRKARKIISRAVADVPVVDLAAISTEERQALLDAITARVNASEAAAEILLFEEALIEELDAFFDRFSSPEPALAFVQEEDWRWIMPFHDGPLPVTILVDRPVGSRHVLLLANDSAVALITAGTE